MWPAWSISAKCLSRTTANRCCLSGALRVVAVFAIDDENGTFDAAEKLYGLRRVKGLRRNSPMQRIKFPDPLALGILLHS